MNARVDLPPAREVCPTTTRHLIGEGALLVDVRELDEVAQVAFDLPGTLLLPLSELEQRFVLGQPAGRTGFPSAFELRHAYHSDASRCTALGNPR